MVAANKQVMDAMFECMNALMAGQGKAADKVTAMIPNSNTGHAFSTMNRKKKKCANCGKLVFHKPETCARVQRKQALPRMETMQDQQCTSMTGTGGIK
jgi:hypothetical protein